MKIVIINGNAKSKKDTFVEYCEQYCKKMNIKVYNYSTIDKVKKIAKKLGWDGVKSDKARKFLSDMKKLWTDYNNGPFINIVEKIEKNKSNNDDIFFIHCREPEEIQKFKEYYNIDCITLFLDKPGHIPDNDSDKNVKYFSYDYWENTDTSDDEIKIMAEKWINQII